jgi:hypothetical protein
LKLWLGLALLIALAGCAGHSKKHSPSTTHTPQQQRSQPQPRDPRNEPFGRLSPSEKRAIVRAYKRLKPLQNGDDSDAALARGRRVCAQLTGPDTTLVARVRADCRNAIGFFSSLRALDAVPHDCDAQREYPTCEQARFLAMAKALGATTSGAAALNDELRQRGIGGLCARSIGIAQAQLDSLRHAQQAARDAAAALAAGDALGYKDSTDQLTKALDASASNDDPLGGIVRGCPTSKPKPLPRVPTQHGINA